MKIAENTDREVIVKIARAITILQTFQPNLSISERDNRDLVEVKGKLIDILKFNGYEFVDVKGSRIKKATSYLSKKIISLNEWNDVIMPLVTAGVLKERKEFQTGFLIIYQTMQGYIEDIDGKVYSCSAWTPPNDKPYVDIKLHNGRN